MPHPEKAKNGSYSNCWNENGIPTQCDPPNTPSPSDPSVPLKRLILQADRRQNHSSSFAALISGKPEGPPAFPGTEMLFLPVLLFPKFGRLFDPIRSIHPTDEMARIRRYQMVRR
jgi:hypothetical protein